jgi:hypothetical protein
MKDRHGFLWIQARDVCVAGLYGNRIEPVEYRRGLPPSGQPVICIRCPDVDEPATDHAEGLTDPDAERRWKEAVLIRCAASGQCSEKQLRTLRAVWVEHEPLRSIAQREGVSYQAIRARIEGLLRKVPEFAADWPWIKRVQRYWWSK